MKSLNRFHSIIESLLQALLKDLISGIKREKVGWESFTDLGLESATLDELLKRGVIEGNSRGQFRLDFRNSRIRQESKTFDLQFEQLDYFLKDIEKIEKSQKILKQIEQMLQIAPEGWKYIIALGWWKMLKFSEMPTKVENVFGEGFSPRDWAITATHSCTQLALEVARKYGKIESFNTGIKFFEKRELLHKDSIVLSPPVSQDKFEKVKKIIRWQNIQMNLTESNIKMLAFFWSLFLILENNHSLPVSIEYSLSVNKTIWESLERLLGREQPSLLAELENSLKILTENGINWASDILRLPGII